MLTSHHKRARCKVFVAVVVLLVGGPKCRRSEPTQHTGDAILAFVAHVSSNSPDESPSVYTVFLRSGRVLRLSGDNDLREARLSTSATAQLCDALTNSGLGSLPEANYFPPDGAHIVVGVRQRGLLKRYAWTGDERCFGPSVSPSHRAFIDAWSKARTALEQAVPSRWAPVPDGREAIEELLAQIYGE